MTDVKISTSHEWHQRLHAALVRTWKVHKAAPDQQVVSLAYTNIRRCAIDLGRSNERRKRREEESVLERGELVAWFELPEDDTSRALQVALSKVPEKFREVITLKIWGELTFDQIRQDPRSFHQYRGLQVSVWDGGAPEVARGREGGDGDVSRVGGDRFSHCQQERSSRPSLP